MPTKFKILAVVAALAAGASSAAMAQYACAPGYAYINGVCQPVRAPGYGNPVTGTVSGEASGAASGYATGGPVGAVVGGALGAATGAVYRHRQYAYAAGNLQLRVRLLQRGLRPSPVGCERRSVRVADKDKGCAGHDRGARADEGDVGALDLT